VPDRGFAEVMQLDSAEDLTDLATGTIRQSVAPDLRNAGTTRFGGRLPWQMPFSISAERREEVLDMAGRAATALAVGWMSVCGGLALATMDHGVWRGELVDWLPSAMSGHSSSVHYKNSDAPYLTMRRELPVRSKGRPLSRSGRGPTGSEQKLFVIVGDLADRGDQLIDGIGLLDCLDIGETGRDADGIAGEKQERYPLVAKLLGKGEARSAAEDEVEDDHVGECRTGKTLAGAFDGMFKVDGCCPRGLRRY
jgi:hypothetical protein